MISRTIRKSFIILFILGSIQGPLLGQDSASLRVNLPIDIGWNQTIEGGKIEFRASVSGEMGHVRYSISPILDNMDIDSTGLFTWQTRENLLRPDENNRDYTLSLTVSDTLSSVTEEFVLTLFKRQVEEARPAEKPTIRDFELPVYAGWNLLKEGDTLRFKVKPITDTGGSEGITFKLEEGEKSTIEFDSTGYFEWSPNFEYVDRFQQTRDKHVFIIGEDSYGNVISEKLVISVFHKNRKPLIDKLLPFYVLLGTNNTYSISNSRVSDPDGDPIVFFSDQQKFPEGMTFSSSGKISWSPSRKQFNDLRVNPINLPFFVEDQPSKERSRGLIYIEASRQDMPPDITMVPSDSIFRLDENERLHLVFHLSDPNGDDDIDQFSFVADDPRIESSVLRRNTNAQYEFVWMPGYEFVNDPDPLLEFDIRFFVLDKSKKSKERSVKVIVKDTENLAKKDKENYGMYRAALVRTLNLIDQLDENKKSQEKELKRAKKGKKNRTLVNIGLGAITGFSPLISQDNTQKTISVIGGTTTTTLGTLEAKDVIGKSVTEITNRIKINTDLTNQLMAEGTALARRYNSKLSRRDRNFTFDLEKLNKIMNSPNLTQLELDASWENKKSLNNRRVKSVFTEFDSMDEKQ